MLRAFLCDSEGPTTFATCLAILLLLLFGNTVQRCSALAFWIGSQITKPSYEKTTSRITFQTRWQELQCAWPSVHFGARCRYAFASGTFNRWLWVKTCQNFWVLSCLVSPKPVGFCGGTDPLATSERPTLSSLRLLAAPRRGTQYLDTLKQFRQARGNSSAKVGFGWFEEWQHVAALWL